MTGVTRRSLRLTVRIVRVAFAAVVFLDVVSAKVTEATSRSLHPRRRSLVIASVVIVALVVFVLDFVSAVWRNHPLTTAVLASALVLAVTVLVVDRLVRQHEASQWERVVGARFTDSLKRVASDVETFSNEVLIGVERQLLGLSTVRITDGLANRAIELALNLTTVSEAWPQLPTFLWSRDLQDLYRDATNLKDGLELIAADLRSAPGPGESDSPKLELVRVYIGDYARSLTKLLDDMDTRRRARMKQDKERRKQDAERSRRRGDRIMVRVERHARYKRIELRIIRRVVNKYGTPDEVVDSEPQHEPETGIDGSSDQP
jgi:hypothetical protein